jgi:uncharacterized Rossmann fold enzyme
MNKAQLARIKKQQAQVKAAAKIREARRKKQQALNKKQRQRAIHPAKQVVRNPLTPPADINPEKYDKECYIIGGGPSLIGFNWKLLDNKFVIAINRAYEVLPDAQIVYFTDDDYYQRHRSEMLRHPGKKFRGRIARKQVIKDPEVLEIQLQQRPFGWSDQFGELYHGSNSSYACIQVAAQLGFNKIYLLGVDMKHQGKFDRKKKNNKGVTHWHNGHKRTDPATAYKMMIGHYNKLAPEATKRGVEIINVNTPDGTALKAFPIKSVKEVFGK